MHRHRSRKIKKAEETEKEENSAFLHSRPSKRPLNGYCYVAIHSFSCSQPPFGTIAFYCHKRLLSLRVYVPLTVGVINLSWKPIMQNLLSFTPWMVISNRYKFEICAGMRCMNRTIAKKISRWFFIFPWNNHF